MYGVVQYSDLSIAQLNQTAKHLESLLLAFPEESREETMFKKQIDSTRNSPLMSPKKKPDALPQIKKPRQRNVDMIVDALSEGDVDEEEDANFDDPKVKKRIADGQGN